MVTMDGRLSVLALPEQQKLEDGSLPHVVVKSDIELQLRRPDNRMARPVVLEAGFTTPYLSMVQVRKQVGCIVVMLRVHLQSADETEEKTWVVGGNIQR